MKRGLEKYLRDPGAFLDDLVQRNELGQPFRLLPHQREVLRLAFVFDADGRLPWDTIVLSAVKKSGKTTLNGALSLWWAFTQEAPNEIPVVANDLEQAQSRVFRAMVGLIQHNPGLTRSAEVQASRILVSNGTEIKAVASDYRGEAGGNHGLTSWDELWGYSSESARRLWEELTPVPTRRNSIRLVTTYAGWEGESDLLLGLYKQGVGTEEHPEGQGERIHSDLPIYANRDARLFVSWDHVARMPWQTAEYYAAQERSLRAGAFRRLHRNEWVSAESAFITPEMWDARVDPNLTPLLPSKQHALFDGVDGAYKHDFLAEVRVFREGDKIVLAGHRIWRPTPGHPLDLEATIEAHLRELHAQYRLQAIRYDPYQLHGPMTRLSAAGLPVQEYPQTVEGTTRMGQVLFDLLKGRNLVLYPSDELREQALNCVAIETARGFRLAKERSSRKIDGIAALAMACVAALGGAPDMGYLPAAGGDRAALVEAWAPRAEARTRRWAAEHDF